MLKIIKNVRSVFFIWNIFCGGLWPKITSWALSSFEDASPSEETKWLKRSVLSLSREVKKKGQRRNSSSDTENPHQRYVQATKAHPLNTWKRRKHKISQQKLSPPHWMHYNYLPGRINVEKTPEQCYPGYHNSQRTERGVWWDGCLSGGLDDQQMQSPDDKEGSI